MATSNLIRIGAGGGGDTPLAMMLSETGDTAIGSGYPLNMIFSFCNKDSINPNETTTPTPGAKYSKWIKENVNAPRRGQRKGLSIQDTIEYLESTAKFSTMTGNDTETSPSISVSDYLNKYLHDSLNQNEHSLGLCYYIVPYTDDTDLNNTKKRHMAINSPTGNGKNTTEFASLYIERIFTKLYPGVNLCMCSTISALTPDRWFGDGNPLLPLPFDVFDLDMNSMKKKDYEEMSKSLTENTRIFADRYKSEFTNCLLALYNLIINSGLTEIILYDVGGDICKGFSQYLDERQVTKKCLLDFGRDENMLLMLLIIKKMLFPALKITVQILGAGTDFWENPEVAEKLIRDVFYGCTPIVTTTEKQLEILTKLQDGKLKLETHDKRMSDNLCFAAKRATCIFMKSLEHQLSKDDEVKEQLKEEITEGVIERKGRATEEFAQQFDGDVRDLVDRNIEKMATIFTYELEITPFFQMCLENICFSVKQNNTLANVAASLSTDTASLSTNTANGGGKKKKSSTGKKKSSTGKKKVIRKHQGIYQSGPKAGKLKPGYRYTGKKTSSGLKVIAKKVSKK